MSEKVFQGPINYLKIVTSFCALMCLLIIFFVGFDPWHSLDAMIWTDLYGSPILPDIAKPAFALSFLLFCWLSVLSMVMLFLITKYSLSKKEKWAYGVIVLIGFLWPLGGSIITYYTNAWSYFISIGMMTALFFPPVVILFPFFKKQKND